MQHEVLLILSGHRSDLLWPDSWRIRSDLASVAQVHVAEIEVLQHFADMGQAYSICSHYIERSNDEFLSKHFGTATADSGLQSPPTRSRSIVMSPGRPPSETKRPTSALPGLYSQALCYGMEDVLDGYRRCILELEQECLMDNTVPLSYYRVKLEDVCICNVY